MAGVVQKVVYQHCTCGCYADVDNVIKLICCRCCCAGAGTPKSLLCNLVVGTKRLTSPHSYRFQRSDVCYARHSCTCKTGIRIWVYCTTHQFSSNVTWHPARSAEQPGHAFTSCLYFMSRPAVRCCFRLCYTSILRNSRNGEEGACSCYLYHVACVRAGPIRAGLQERAWCSCPSCMDATWVQLQLTGCVALHERY
jgi:hypothetical protein